jgi:hypothetical protein
MANYIFVDFDGPLLSGKMFLFNKNREATDEFLNGGSPIPYFDPVAVRMVNLWAKYGNAKVVFSTSWHRIAKGDFEQRENYLKLIMETNGYTGEYADAATTPKRLTSEHIHEISEWCYDNLKPEDKFIAIDDANLSYLEDDDCLYKSRGKWLKVDYNEGLTWKNFKDGCAHLDINNEELLYKEFGIVPPTKQEKEQREKDLDTLLALI